MVFTHADKLVVLTVIITAIIFLLIAWVDRHRNAQLYEMPEDWSEVKDYGGRGER